MFLYYKYSIMLLDNIFPAGEPKQLIIVRKNGKLRHVTRPLVSTTEHDQADKPLFPISKDRAKE